MKSLAKLTLIPALSALLLCINTTALAKPQKVKSAQNDKNLQLAYEQLIGSTANKKPTKNAKAKTNRNTPSRYLAVQTAKKQLRKKYRWGGSMPHTGFDCSGLTQYAYKKAQVQLPRTAAAQYKHTKRVSLSKIQTGDLIFFHTRSRSRKRINHVGIYLGGGNFIHAPSRGKRVSVAKLNKYWRRKAISGGRV